MNTIDEKTFKQGVDEFIGCAPEGGWSDYWAMQQDWEFYKDSLCRDGVITQKQADSWSNPCTPETFARWQKRNGLVRRGYESKKSEGHDTIVDYFHSDPEVENSEALEDLTVTVSDNGCDTDSVMEDGESYVELCTWLPDGTSVAITVGICDDGNNDKATYAIDVGKTIGRSPITEWDKAYTADELSQMWVDFEDDLKKVIAEHPVGESKKKEPKGESHKKSEGADDKVVPDENDFEKCPYCGSHNTDIHYEVDLAIPADVLAYATCKDCGKEYHGQFVFTGAYYGKDEHDYDPIDTCPFCGSKEHTETVQFDGGGYVDQDFKCKSCGGTWYNSFVWSDTQSAFESHTHKSESKKSEGLPFGKRFKDAAGHTIELSDWRIKEDDLGYFCGYDKGGKPIFDQDISKAVVFPFDQENYPNDEVSKEMDRLWKMGYTNTRKLQKATRVESKKSEDTYDRPVTLYASTRYDDAEEAQKFLDSISGGEVKVSKERNGDTLYVSIEGDDDAIDTFLAVYKDNYDTLEKDCDADVNGWTDPVDLKYYTVQGRKELTGESHKKSEDLADDVAASKEKSMLRSECEEYRQAFANLNDKYNKELSEAGITGIVPVFRPEDPYPTVDGHAVNVEFQPFNAEGDWVQNNDFIQKTNGVISAETFEGETEVSDYCPLDAGSSKDYTSEVVNGSPDVRGYDLVFLWVLKQFKAANPKKSILHDKQYAESKKSEGIGDRIKMGVDYNMFMRMCGSAAYLDDNEDYWDALWEYYSEMGEIEDACEFFDNLFQYTAWCDEDEVYDEYLDDKFKDESKSKEECIQAAIDDGDLNAYKHEKGNYLVLL